MSSRITRDKEYEYGCDCTLENCCGKDGCEETAVVALEERAAFDGPLPSGWVEVAVNIGSSGADCFDREWSDGEYYPGSPKPASLHLCADCSLRECDFAADARARRCDNCRVRVVDPDGSNDLLDWKNGGWFRCAACEAIYQAHDALGLPMPLVERTCR